MNSMAADALLSRAQSSNLFDNADAAWRAALAALVAHGSSVDAVTDELSIGSWFGAKLRATRELVAVQFGIANPRRRLIASPRRRFNLAHSVAQLFWIISGTDDVRSISFYHPCGANLSDDGLTLFAAPGARIFSTPHGDQFESAVERLSEDSTTRRAVIQLFIPSDAIEAHRDISCFLSVQLMIREGRVAALGLMRSQSAAMVLPHDLFLLTMLQEAVAARLGLALGPYYHWSGSMHFYEDDAALVAEILREVPQSLPEMRPMPALSSAWRHELIAAERDIRQQLTANIAAPVDVSRYNVDSYWAGLLAVLVAGARKEHGSSVLESDTEQIPPELRLILS